MVHPNRRHVAHAHRRAALGAQDAWLLQDGAGIVEYGHSGGLLATTLATGLMLGQPMVKHLSGRLTKQMTHLDKHRIDHHPTPCWLQFPAAVCRSAQCRSGNVTCPSQVDDLSQKYQLFLNSCAPCKFFYFTVLLKR